jgi:hypothetical protein
MDPAVLAHLVRGLGVKALAGVQPPHQIAAKLCPVGLVLALSFKLSQPLARPADHEIAHPHALAAQAQSVERLAHGWCLGD